jgi:hypothetical protein
MRAEIYLPECDQVIGVETVSLFQSPIYFALAPTDHRSIKAKLCTFVKKPSG